MVEKAKVLLVEDEKDISDLMLLHLKREGHEVTRVEDGESALKLFTSEKFDLLILDWMLPGLSGLDICKKVRMQGSEIPVLMVTARADTTDIVLGLEMGADDYITKPFELPVFIARVRSLLRRSKAMSEPPSKKVEIGELLMDEEAHEIFCAGTPLQLTPSEFKLLGALMRNQGRVLSRERLINLVQGDGVVVIDRAIDTHVFGLRKKLGACADLVETIRGIGYRIK